MFFCPELLMKRGHPFFVVWIAATQKGDRLNRYLTPRKVAKLDVDHVIEDVLKRVIVTSSIPRQLAMHNGCFSLYLSAQIMFGCSVALNRKATILINDLGRISKNLRKMRFCSDKSQMVLQVPKKSGKKGSICMKNPFELAGRQLCDIPHDFRNILETLSVGNIVEIIPVDDGEQEPLEYTHSVPEATITLEEILFFPRDEDTRFGDEGDGGRGFVDFLNGDEPGIETGLVNADALPQHDPVEANFDRHAADIEELQSGNIETSSQIHVTGVDLATNDSPPIASLELQPNGTPWRMSVVRLEPELQPIPLDPGHDAITGGILEPLFDEISLAVPPELEQPSIVDRIDDDHPEEIAPMPDQDYKAGGLPEARPDDNIHIQPTLFQGDSNMELPELNETPETGRKRKRPTHLIIDKTIRIPASVIRRRIDNMAEDTLRKVDSYEDSMSMLIKTKWLNLEQLRLPGRSGLGCSGPLATLFSRHFVTRPDPSDDDDFDLDQTLNQPGRRESSLATPQAQAHFPVTSTPSLLEGRNQTETMDTLNLSPERPSETVLIKSSTPPGARIDSLNEPFIIGGTPTEQEKERRPKRSREKFQSLDHLELPTPKRQNFTETVEEVSANKKVAALEPTKLVEGFQDQETFRRAEVAENFQDQGIGMGLEADSRAQDGCTMNSLEIADTGAQDIPGHSVTANLPDSLLGQETVTAFNFQEGTNTVVENSPEQIQRKGDEDPNGGTQTKPKRRRQESGVDVEKESVGDYSSSSRGSNALQNVMESASELAREKGESTIPIADLCPPSTKRRQAADFFSALLDLHKKKQVTMHQDKDELHVGPISITVNVLS